MASGVDILWGGGGVITFKIQIMSWRNPIMLCNTDIVQFMIAFVFWRYKVHRRTSYQSIISKIALHVTSYLMNIMLVERLDMTSSQTSRCHVASRFPPVCRRRLNSPKSASRGKLFTAVFLLLNRCKTTFKVYKIFLSCLKNYNFWFMGIYSKFSLRIFTSDSSGMSGIKTNMEPCSTQENNLSFSGFPKR